MTGTAVASGGPLVHPRDQDKGSKRPKLKTKLQEKPRAKLLKLPDIVKRIDNASQSQASLQGQNLDKQANPFRMPTDTEVFAIRESERRQKEQAKHEAKSLSVYQKNVVTRKNFKALLAEDTEDQEFYEKLRKRDSDKIIMKGQGARADRHFAKENLHDFIAKKREMFLVQYALGVKREEMRKLEEIAQAEEQKLLEDEKALEEDAAKFDAFLKENDKNSVEAIKRAELETKAKLEKIQEIKKINVHIMSIRSDMSKNEDQLKDLQRYRQFLDKLTPGEFFEDQRQRRKAATGTDAKKKADDATGPNKKGKDKVGKGAQAKAKSRARGGKGDQAGARHGGEEVEEDAAGSGDEIDDEEEDYLYDGNPEDLIYFKSPQQLLDMFAELEENNLALIQNCQETEETLEELKQKIAETETRMDKETQSLKQQIEFLNAAISREEDKARALEDRSKLLSSGVVGAESQEKLLDELNHKVKDVYKRCIGDNEANLSTLQMLTNIENRLEQLFETIELMPSDKVEQAEKMKDKERRQRLREEKMEAQRLLQEERVQRALERAQAPVKKKAGKPVVFRSAPPQKKKMKEETTKKKEEEDLEYYWT